MSALLSKESQHKQDDAHLSLARDCVGTKVRSCECARCASAKALLKKLDEAFKAQRRRPRNHRATTA